MVSSATERASAAVARARARRRAGLSDRARVRMNDDLREEWEKYLEQTKQHVESCATSARRWVSIPGEMTPGCKVVQHTGKSLVIAMKMALAAGDPTGGRARRVRVRRARRDEGSRRLGADRRVREGTRRRCRRRLKEAYERSRGRRRRASLPHEGLVPGAVAQVAGPEGGAAAAGGKANVKTANEAAEVEEATKRRR